MSEIFDRLSNQRPAVIVFVVSSALFLVIVLVAMLYVGIANVFSWIEKVWT